MPQSLQDVLISMAYNHQHRISRLKYSVDKYRSLCGLYLLKLGLERLAIPTNIWQSLHFAPSIKPKVDYPIEFSISHSNALILCALSLSTKVGIDAEYLSKTKQGNKQQINPRNRLATIREWTCKEAIVKAQGSSSVADINKVILNQQTGQFNNHSWFLRAIEIHPDYTVRIATNDNNATLHLHHIQTI